MNALVFGAYWGDEGKGKIVDLLAADSDWVVRYNGGDNAGHTIVVDGKSVVLHVLPSGVLQGKNTLIGPDVFFNPGSFLKDLITVEENGFKIKGKIVIDERAHVIMPYHIVLDTKKEEKSAIGTTKRGIGPAAKDKAERTTDITVSDMVSESFLDKIKDILNTRNDVDKYSKKVYEVYSGYAAKIKKYVRESTYLLNDELKKGKSVLIEAAQGSLLDVVHGTRPYVTSSNTIAGGAAANLGIDLRKFQIIGIVKAYPTRVGEGNFVTELGEYEQTKQEQSKQLTVAERRKVIDGDKNLLGRWIRFDGAEYGATTGRPRRTGQPDFVALKYSAMINAVNKWIITKIDVLSGKTFKAAIAYKKNKEITEKFPFRLDGWKPVYGTREYFWPKMNEEECIAAVNGGYETLPEGMKQYIKDLVIYTRVPVSMISLSPKREITLVKDVLEKTSEYLK
jgi:adenylosuccinate synthase